MLIAKWLKDKLRRKKDEAVEKKERAKKLEEHFMKQKAFEESVKRGEY